VGVLTVLVAISFVMDVWMADPGDKDWTSIVVVTTMIVLSALLRFTQEWKANRSSEALQKMVTNTCYVVRAGTASRGGLILKDGFTVRGLNTAATIWCSAACGTLSGVGAYCEAAVLVACVLITHCLFRPLCTFLEKRTAKVFHYSMRAECQRNASGSVQKLIMDTLAFDQDVRLNSLFYKGDDDRVTVCCDIETLGEHKVLLDLVVSRLRSRSEVFSAGWEKEESPQEDF
jgi:hypothetical protein